MNRYTFFQQKWNKPRGTSMMMLFLSLFCLPFAYSQNTLNLQCPADVEVGPFDGECGHFLDFGSLNWTTDVPPASVVFTPGSSFYFPFGTTPVTLSVSDSSGNLEACSFHVTVHPPNQFLVCNNFKVIEFENSCTRTISAFDILEGGPYACEDFYDVLIIDQLGGPLGNVVDTSFLNITYTVKVNEVNTGNTCWGSILVEPNGIPQIMTCPPDITILCHEPTDSVGFPVIDGCFSESGYNHTYFDNVENSFCDGDNIAYTLTREWMTSDPFGNSTNCTQLITGKRVEFSDIDFPKNFDGVDLPKLNCADITDMFVDTDTSMTGIPLVNGLDPRGLVCNMAFLVSDSIENTCGNNYIIKRKWQAFDFCLDEFYAHTQTIIVADEEAPAFTVPDTLLVSTDDNCSGVVRLPRINLMQECSPYSILIETPWNTFTMDSVIAPVVDIPGNYNAIYTATDDCGNIGKDTIVLHVTEAPVAICLEEETINADFYLTHFQTALDSGNYSVLDIFGEPSFFENCTNSPDVEVQINLNACFEGQLLRQHSINFNGGTIQCEQKINVHHVSDFVVEFPADLNYHCNNDPVDFGEPEIFFETCELIAVSYEDEVFNSVADACYRINRQWTVINWCVVGDELDQEVVESSEEEFINGNCDLLFDCDFNMDFMCNNRTFRDSWSICNLPGLNEATNNMGPDTDPDSDPWDGYITYLQTIKVIDVIDPVFVNGCDLPEVCTDSNICIANLLLPTPEVQECGLDAAISTSIRINDIWYDGAGPYNLGPGVYVVRYVAADNCNNQTACETEIIIKDCSPPTVVCKASFDLPLVFVNQFPAVTLLADDLIETAFDNCTDEIDISFSPNINDNIRNYTCDDLGVNLVQIWVTDENGYQYSCVSEVHVFEGFNSDCGEVGPGINGNIDNEFLEGINDVEVLNTFNFPSQTNAFGSYFISNLNQAFPVFILPKKDVDHNNGVTTFDIVLLIKHILGVEPLNSPYKLIAADINRSNTVTTFDAVEMRKLILGINTEFPNNTSWRFIPKEFVFDDPANPFAQPIPDTVWVNGPNVLQVDFIGMKIGDLNGSASVGFTENNEERNTGELISLKSENIHFNKGELIEVPFYFKQNNIIGFQGELDFDLQGLDLLEIKDGLLKEEHFGKNKLKDGLLKFSFNQNENIISGKNYPLFTLVFRTFSTGETKNRIAINDRGLKAEGYTDLLSIHAMSLDFQSNDHAIKNYFKLSPARPNPFTQKTTLSFYLPATGDVRFSFIAADGKLLKSYQANFVAGDSFIEITRTDLGQNGIIFCKIETAYGTGITRLVLLD